MTEFEIASLDFQELSAWSTFAYAIVSLLVGLAQCGLIGWGIWEMRKSSIERAEDRREARDADVRRHEEAMTALQELIRRTATPIAEAA